MPLDISLNSDKRAAVRSMLENWPRPGIVALGPHQMLAILDAYERMEADNSRLRKLVAEAEDNGACDNPTVRVCPWCQLTVATQGHQKDCEAFSAPGVVR